MVNIAVLRRKKSYNDIAVGKNRKPRILWDEYETTQLLKAHHHIITKFHFPSLHKICKLFVLNTSSRKSHSSIKRKLSSLLKVVNWDKYFVDMFWKEYTLGSQVLPYPNVQKKRVEETSVYNSLQCSSFKTNTSSSYEKIFFRNIGDA